MYKETVLCLCWLALAAALQCPDGSICQDRNTCCKNSAGGYGCCPSPHTLSALLMVPSSSERVHPRICPDGSHCPSEYSCVETPAGLYACSPLPQAVSCADGKHSCPVGHQCSHDGSSCTELKEPSGVEAVICPDQVSECPDGTTCCQIPDGSWGCCPMEKAVCCEDKMHCCPEGTTCDLEHSKCKSATKDMPMWAKFPARKRAAWEDQQVLGGETVQCPDGKSQCPDGTTCCQTTTGSYGCCPFTDAVCCTDHLHCCPGGTTCDLEHSVCKSATKETPLWTKLPAVLRDVTCPDGRSKCPDETTCCLLSNGSYGCCPLPNAVCCNDHKHCCPQGTTCDLAHTKCISADGTKTTWSEKLPALETEARDVQCDSTAACPKGHTCCRTKAGGWACCPIPEAECCSDFVHCCPKGYTCNVEASSCEQKSLVFPWLSQRPLTLVKAPMSRVPVRASDVPCDDTTSCPDGSTCCKTTQGGWTCCPSAKAVCCEDHVHCCPEGTTCDVAAGTCDSSTASVPWLKKVPAVSRVPVGARDIPCDDTTSCPDGSTCCKTTQGGWACCPLAKAVCCEDHVHCCPEGTTCDVAAGTCDSSTASVPWLKKVPAVSRVPVGARDIPCDDTTSCPDGSTCCKTTQGGWACCPLAKAVCCEDHVHCCPEGTTCDVAAGTCDSSTASVPWLKKVPAVSRVPVGARDIPCDDTTSCPDGSTCCKTTQGGWACCPLAKAVCCEDHVHCCPEGTTCDVAAGTCDSSTASVPWLKKVPAVSRVPVGARDIPCDDTTSCPDGSTCCKTTQGGWACCPLAKAVCCEDHVHCCPEGTTCDVAAGTCDSSTASVPWLKKVPAVSRVPVGARDIPCDDTTSCPDGSTCCKTTQGGWACCPLAKAVCCEDHVHCCPEGTTCDVAAGTCDSSTASVPWLKKVPAVSRVPVGARDIPCDDTTSCPDGSTCCKTTQGGWACCPLAKAVCCEDHVHCCPEGTTCDVAAGMCDSSTASVPWLKKVPAVSRVPKDEKCDDHTSCPRSTTCCQQSPGKWACCPLPHAVCCEDGEHCCPRGYRCDVTKTSCIKEGQEIPWSRKLKASSTPAGPQDVRCDPQTSCASGTTCCQLPTGKWGCCPLVKAVCCSDHEHCCPQGYRCNIEAGTCEKQGEPFVWLTHTAPLVRVSGLAAQSSQLQRDIKCSDTFQCSDGETCCQITAHSWACCPFPQAVCCADKRHCCPAGYTCDVAGRGCDKDGHLSWDVFLGDQRRALDPL